MNEPDISVARYWDANREKARDPTFWMAHPVCRQATNRRVSGSPHEWPLDWFKRVYVRAPFEHGISWGCGLGAFERAAIRSGVVRTVDAFDISPASLRDARVEAEREGIEGITYREGDFNHPEIENGRYDIVFFHQSLHHVMALERLFRQLALALRPGALVYVDEYVGPSRDSWTTEDLRLGQSILNLLPGEARLEDILEFPIEAGDPSEAVRSHEIPVFLTDFFDVLAWRPYGGQLVDLLFPCLDPEWLASQEGYRAVDAILAIEDDEMSKRPRSTHHLVMVGRLKPLRRLMRPLGRQVVAAVRRRIRPTQ